MPATIRPVCRAMLIGLILLICLPSLPPAHAARPPHPAPAATIPATPTGDDPAEIEVMRLSGVGGSMGSVVIRGTLAYLAEGQALRVLDIQDPGHPAPQMTLLLPSAAQDMKIAGSLLYIAAGDTGPFTTIAGQLLIVDLSDPRHPSLLSSLTVPSVAQIIQVVGSHAYLGSLSIGLHIVDIHNPLRPQMLSTYVVTEDAGIGEDRRLRDMQVVGHRAYIAAGDNGLRIIDVSNPRAPSLLSHFGPYEIVALEVIGTTIYASIFSGPLRDLQGGVAILDAQDPRQPTMVGTYATNAHFQRIAAAGQRLYLQEATQLRILGLSDPGQPQFLGSYQFDGWSAENIWAVDWWINEDYAAITSSANRLDLLDLSNPAAPTRIGVYQPAIGQVYDSTVVDSTAYLIDSNSGLNILDVSKTLCHDLLDAELSFGWQNCVIGITTTYLEHPAAVGASSFGCGAACSRARTLPRQHAPCGFRRSQAHAPALIPAVIAAMIVCPAPCCAAVAN